MWLRDMLPRVIEFVIAICAISFTVFGLRSLGFGVSLLHQPVDDVAIDEIQRSSQQIELNDLQQQLGISSSAASLIDNAQVYGLADGRLSSRTELRLVDVGPEVEKGDAVLFKNQLIGRIDQRDASGDATVRLLGDSSVRPAIRLKGDRTLEGVLLPQSGGVIVRHLEGVDLDTGSLIETSGLGGVYPAGLIVGRLSEKIDGGDYAVQLSWSASELTVVQIVR